MASIITDAAPYFALFYTLRAYIGGVVGTFQGSAPALLDGDRAIVFKADPFALPRGAQTAISYPPRRLLKVKRADLSEALAPLPVEREQVLYTRMRYGMPVYFSETHRLDTMLIYEIEVMENYYSKVKAKLDFLIGETLDQPFPLTADPR